jgi:ABC-2 type transport system permease protein
MRAFSLQRLFAVLAKEFIQMRRDRLTAAMVLGIPVLQLMLFGFAINLNPKNLPTAIAIDDPGRFGRSIVAALVNSTSSRLSNRRTHLPMPAACWTRVR